MKEIWRDIDGYEGFYQVSNTGKIKSLPRVARRSNGWDYTVKERELKQYELKFKDSNKQPRKLVHLKSNGSKRFLVHRIVAEAFIPNPDCLPQVNHKDGDSFNNMADNLEWVTNRENAIHAYENGLMKTERSVIRICDITKKEIKTYKSVSQAAREHKITPGAITHAIRNGWRAGGFYWKYKS